MNITEHFTLEELCHTDTGIDNTPTQEIVGNLTVLAIDILEPTRTAWGSIKVNCAYRSDAVNKAVGGVTGSEHSLGKAADIKPLNVPLEEVYDWITKNIRFGQCILEDKNGIKWIHVSLPRENKPNNESLVARLVDGKMKYEPYDGIA